MDMEDMDREKAVETVRNYLGIGKKIEKKRFVKPSDKFRFKFDWDQSEDTFVDSNPLYQNPHEARLLFGRGFRAGIDRREQKKRNKSNNIVYTNLYDDDTSRREQQHWSKKEVEEMTDRCWRIFMEDFDISYKGKGCSGFRNPRPMRNWEEGGLSDDLLEAVTRRYKNPTPIQMAVIPVGLQQRDVVGVSQTGSGKTAAFVIPMLSYVLNQPVTVTGDDNCSEGPYALVLAPTRELVQQIEDEVLKFSRYLGGSKGIRVVSIVGGRSIQEQGLKVSQGCDVLIATPGRLIDCLERRYVVLHQCKYVVLDEADRMIDMGFEQQVECVLNTMSKEVNRVTSMFSATMAPAVERLARKYLRNPVVVTIGNEGKTTDSIKQNVIMVKESEKLYRLRKLLTEVGDEKKTIVFVNTKNAVDVLYKSLKADGFRITTLRGGTSQEQREISLEGFRAKKYNVLVATDVAGRGIDIPDVAHVVNYDMPPSIVNYTHRIGRTGRAGKTGVATTFLTLHDTSVFHELTQTLLQSNNHVPSELAKHRASKFKSVFDHRVDFV